MHFVTFRPGNCVGGVSIYRLNSQNKKFIAFIKSCWTEFNENSRHKLKVRAELLLSLRNRLNHRTSINYKEIPGTD